MARKTRLRSQGLKADRSFYRKAVLACAGRVWHEVAFEYPTQTQGEVAEVGDAIELRGPIGGHFVWEVKDGGPLLLLGGGSGIVPLMSMLRHRAAVGSRVPALLLFSSRTWEDVIFRDELLALDAKNDGFQLALALTRDQPRREQDFGRRVDAAMVAELVNRLPEPPKHVFICGGNPFVEAAAQGAIEAGVAPSMIRTERYGG